MYPTQQATVKKANQLVIPVMSIVRNINLSLGRHEYDPNSIGADQVVLHAIGVIHNHGLQLLPEIGQLIQNLCNEGDEGKNPYRSICIFGLLGYCCPETCNRCQPLNKDANEWSLWKKQLKPNKQNRTLNHPHQNAPQFVQPLPAFSQQPTAPLCPYTQGQRKMASTLPLVDPYSYAAGPVHQDQIAPVMFESMLEPMACVNPTTCQQLSRGNSIRQTIEDDGQLFRRQLENPFADPADFPVSVSRMDVLQRPQYQPQQYQPQQHQQQRPQLPKQYEQPQLPKLSKLSKLPPSEVDCLYGLKCTKSDCKFRHPSKERCKYGSACTRQGCWYDHTDGPNSNVVEFKCKNSQHIPTNATSNAKPCTKPTDKPVVAKKKSLNGSRPGLRENLPPKSFQV